MEISKALVLTASTRMFSDPTQSILELPVNSIDAYSPNCKIGKFGMGFFSFLWWIYEKPKRGVLVQNYYKSQSGEYQNYQILIRY